MWKHSVPAPPGVHSLGVLRCWRAAQLLVLAFVMLFPNGIIVWIFRLRCFAREHEDGPVELSVSRWVLSGIAS